MAHSIIDTRPALRAEILKTAEAAGYLWQKGWAERNGGNITVNITEYVDDEMRSLPAISPRRETGVYLPHLKGCWFARVRESGCATLPANRWRTAPSSG